MTVEPAFRKLIVVVMGSSTSGVTSFINRVSELAPQTVPDPNPSDTLKPLDYGRLTIDPANVIYLYGISEETPRSAWSFLFERDDLIGVIALVDSTRPESFSIDKALIRDVGDVVPYLIAANKQDCTDAWELEAIQIALNLHDSPPITGCSTKTGQGVREAVLSIVDLLLSDDDHDEPDDDTEPQQTSFFASDAGAD